MKILFLTILFIPTAFSFDPARLKADMDTIHNEFIPIEGQSAVAPTKKRLSRAVAPTKTNQIENLEGKYFDTVSRKLAAPKVIKKSRFERKR